MKKRTRCLKATVAVLSVVLAMLMGIAGTLAYLKAETTPVINTFSPSNINLKLEETNVDGESDKANTYKMIPGVDIAKDPKVTVKADIDCYVFVQVEESANFDTYMTYAIASDWKLLNTNTGEETEIADKTKLNGTYVLFREVTADVAKDGEAFYVLAGNTTYPNGVVHIPNTVTKTQMDALYTDGAVNTTAQPKLTFTAYAIQKAGFENDLVGAWTAAQGLQNN